MTGNFRNSAMLVKLSKQVWTARKFDKKATKEIADAHNVSDKALRTTKRLFPEHAETYKAICSASAELTHEFHAQTLPWNDDGTRILTTVNYIPGGTAIRNKIDVFKGTWPPFFEQYPFLVSQARNALGSLWRADDYPDRYEIRERFSVSLEFFPIPDAADFRADIAQEDLNQIQEQITGSVEQRIQSAMDEPYRRLFDGVAHMAARLSGAKTCACRACKGKTYETDQFGDSLVDNLIGLVETLPRLNLTGDEELTLAIEEVKAGLVQFSPDTIRASEPIRKTLAERAAEIQRNLAGYMGAAA